MTARSCSSATSAAATWPCRCSTGRRRGPGPPAALPVVEAVPREEEFYDYESRYEIGMTTFVCPAELPRETTARAQELAVRVYELLGCHGVARVDLMLEQDSGELWVLETNVVPGMTETSLLPQAADAAGHRLRGAGRADPGERLHALGDAPPECRAERRLRRVAGVSAVAGGEVLGGDAVEELLELLDHVLGLLDVVLELDRRLRDDLLGGVDRGAGADRQRDRVARAGVDLELASADAEGDRGEEGVLAQLGDRDLGAA